MKIFFFKMMKKTVNELEAIYLTLKDFYDEKLVLHEKIARISEFSKKHLCHNTFMTSLNQTVSVFKEITIDNVISLNIYENPSFCSTLLVFKNGILTPWLKLKFSSIENSGLGVFSSRNFKKNEFITCYLGEINQDPSEEEYTFKKINGKPVNSLSGLVEDYWFGHRIQHGSGNQDNVTITSGYVIKAKKDIEIGEELFLDYNRSIVCGECKVETDFYNQCLNKSMKCNLCGNKGSNVKKCNKCETFLICLQCYDKSQTTF